MVSGEKEIYGYFEVDNPYDKILLKKQDGCIKIWNDYLVGDDNENDLVLRDFLDEGEITLEE
jgi:hypothetical protein